MSGTTLDSAAIAAIVELANGAAGIVEIDGVPYSRSHLRDMRDSEPRVDEIKLSTLESLLKFYNAEHPVPMDLNDVPVERFVHVESPTRVSIVTFCYGRERTRSVLCVAEAIVPDITFGRFMDPERFNIELQAKYLDTEARAAVLAVVGNLTTEAVQQREDDGTSQRVTAKRGLMKAAIPVPNPVMLAPRSSFPEVGQVERPFILRLRGGSEKTLPECALHEADGGGWRLEAIARIASYLRGSLAGAHVLA